MAGNEALLASLLLGQRQKPDPLDIYRKFGGQQVAAGSSTAPLGSGNPLEGVARALQGGIGGLMQGYAMGKQTEQDDALNAGLSKASTAKTPEEIAAALQGLKGSDANAVLGQIVQGRLDQLLTQQRAGTQLGALGGAPAAAPPTGPIQQGGGAAPPGGIPQPGYGASSAPGGISSNNIGNITNGQGGFRQYATPQAGAADAATLLRRYPVEYNNGQPMTLTQIAARYAPADDGRDPMLKGNDPAVWARNVGQIAGIDPNTPLDFDDPAILTKVVNGINAQEKGRGAAQPAPVLNQGVAQAMDPTAFPPPAAAAPGTPGPVTAVPAQGAGPTPAPQAAPTSSPSSPAGDRLRQSAQQAQQAGDNVTALKFQQEAIQEDAKWMTEVGKKNLDQPQQAFQNESKLRSEFETQPAIKSYNTVVPILEAAKKAGKTRAGDLNLIYAFAKLMDPDSVVRESETGAVVATQSVMDRIGAYVGQLNGQQMLNDDARAKLLAELDGRFGALQQSRDALAQQYGSIANAHGISPDRVVTNVRIPGSGPAGGSAGGVPPPPPGFRPIQ